jgi:hypothetical protein
MALFSETKVAQRGDIVLEPGLSFERAYSEALENKILPYVKPQPNGVWGF